MLDLGFSHHKYVLASPQITPANADRYHEHSFAPAGRAVVPHGLERR